MELQYISDGAGNHTAVVIPIKDWNNITAKHGYLKELIVAKQVKNNDASRFKGLLTNEEADKYDQYLKNARSEWDRDI